jgi:hypothetical protein
VNSPLPLCVPRRQRVVHRCGFRPQGEGRCTGSRPGRVGATSDRDLILGLSVTVCRQLRARPVLDREGRGRGAGALAPSASQRLAWPGPVARGRLDSIPTLADPAGPRGADHLCPDQRRGRRAPRHHGARSRSWGGRLCMLIGAIGALGAGIQIMAQPRARSGGGPGPGPTPTASSAVWRIGCSTDAAISRARGDVAVAADSLIASHVNCRKGPMALVPSRSRRRQLLDPRRPRELAERRREVRVIGLHDPGFAVGQVGRRPPHHSAERRQYPRPHDREGSRRVQDASLPLRRTSRRPRRPE